MSDYQNPNDPMWQGREHEPAGHPYASGWAWIAGAALVVIIVLAVVFGSGHGPTKTAYNATGPTAGSTASPPAHAPLAANPAQPGLTPPPPANPAGPAAPAAPAPPAK